MKVRILLLAVSCLLSAVSAQWLETTIHLLDSLRGLDEPWAAHYVPSANCVYVCGEEGVMVVDCATNARIARLDLYEPLDLAFDPRDSKVYLNSYESDDSLAVIDAATHQVISRLWVGSEVAQMRYNQAANKLYCVVGRYSDTVAVVDCSVDSVLAHVWVGHNDDYYVRLCCSEPGNKVYVTSYDSAAVAVIDGTGDSLLKLLPVGGWPRGLAYSTVSNKLYCSVHDSDDLAVIDCGPDTLLGRVPVGDGPVALGFNPQSNKVYCADWHSGDVDVVDCHGDTLLGRLALEVEDLELFVLDSVDNRVFCVGSYFERIPVVCGWGDSIVGEVEVVGESEFSKVACYSPVQNRLYVVRYYEPADLVVVDAGTCAVLGEVQLSAEPTELCLCPQHGKLYCLDENRGTVVVIDCATNRLLRKISTPATELEKPVYSPQSDRLYCAAEWAGDDVLMAIDCATDSVLTMLPMDRSPTALTYNPASNKVYWANYDYDPSTVTVVDCRTDSIVALVPVGSYPCALACNPDSNRVYCASHLDDTLLICAIDGAGDTTTGTVKACRNSSGSQVALCYVPSLDVVCSTTRDTYIVVVDGAARQVLGPLSVGGRPSALLFNGVSNKLYCLLSESNELAVIDCRYMSPEGKVRVGADPRALALDSIANRVYVIHPWAGCASIIDGRTSRLVRLVEAGRNPVALVWAPEYRRMYMADRNGEAVVVLKDTAVTAVAGEPAAEAGHPVPSVTRGVLKMGYNKPNTGYRAELLDATGRRVMALRPGPNDVRLLAPGVYFITEQSAISSQHSGPASVTKVIVVR